MHRIELFATKTIRVCFILLALLVPLLLTPVNYELFEYNKMMAVYGITAIIACSWVSTMIVQKRLFIARTPFDIPIGLFVLSQFISTLFSMDPHVSWFGYYSRFNGGMLSILCYSILYYAFVSTQSKDILPKLLRFLLGTATVIAFYGVLEHFGIDKHLWVQDVQNRVFSTLGQPNWLAAYLVSLIPLSLAIAYERKQIWPRSLVPAGLTILFFLTLLFTRSRSGLFACLVVDVIFWLVVILRTPNKRTLRTSLFLVHITFALLIFFTGTHVEKLDRWITFDGWRNQLITAKQEATKSAETMENAAETVAAGPVLETGGTESGVIRSFVWQGAINAWKGSPKNIILGTGTETFAFAFYAFKPVGHNLTSEWDYLYNKAHNEYLNVLATTGLFGCVTYLFLLGSIALFFIKKIRNAHEQYVLLFGIALGWLSILITNFFGFSVVVTQLLLYLLPAAALLFTSSVGAMVEKPLRFASEKKQKITLGITIGVTVLLCGVLTISWIADKTFATGYRLARAGQYARAYGPLMQATILNPTEPLFKDEYANTLSALAVAAIDNQDATLAGTLATYAVEQNDAAIAISPLNVNFWKSKTKIYYALATLDETFLPLAIQALEYAKTLSPNDPKIAYNLAILEGKIGGADQAITYLQQAIALKSNYRDAYYALYIFLKETGSRDEANALIQTYLSTINSQDVEFQKLIE